MAPGLIYPIADLFNNASCTMFFFSQTNAFWREKNRKSLLYFGLGFPLLVQMNVFSHSN